jgi:hypothetical protein
LNDSRKWARLRPIRQARFDPQPTTTAADPQE